MQQRRAERRTAEAISDVGESAREAANRAQSSAVNGFDGVREFQLTLVGAAQENVNACFDYVQSALQAKSIQDLVEVTTSHSRRQLQMSAEQARELAECARNATKNTRTPFTSMFGTSKESS
jgi:hypothetical protein